MSELIQKINETLEVIRNFTRDNYPIGIILGTGLGGLVKEINIKHEIDLDVYSDTSFQKSRIVSQEISWKSLEGFKNCYLYLDSNDTDTIFIDVISVFENCCTSHYISDFTINGHQLPYDAVDYNYLLYKKNPGFNRDF